MIRSFGDKQTESPFDDTFVRDFQGVPRRAKRKLEAVNAAIPPSNHLERLQGVWKDFHSIRINDQWRVVFRWIDGGAYDVRIVDYH
jgi:proteic killer suppression protein